MWTNFEERKKERKKERNKEKNKQTKNQRKLVTFYTKGDLREVRQLWKEKRNVEKI